MKITSIKQQHKQPDRYAIFIDDAYAFSLSEEALLAQKLTRGQELDAKQLQAFQREAADDSLYQMTLRYAALRNHSRWEFETYLRRKHAAEPLAQHILHKLRDSGLIDDERFARSWVENRQLLKPISKRRLILELKQKRVSEALITKVLSEDLTDERHNLRALVQKKRKQTKFQADDLKLMQYLARQGFAYDDIKEVLQSETAED